MTAARGVSCSPLSDPLSSFSLDQELAQLRQPERAPGPRGRPQGGRLRRPRPGGAFGTGGGEQEARGTAALPPSSSLTGQMRRPSSPGAGDRGSVGPASRLDGVTERFQSFFGDLEQEKQQRRLEEAAWHSQVQDMFTKVERSIEAEVRRRAEADKKLQTHFDNEVMRLQERICAQVSEWQDTMKSTLDTLAKSVQGVKQSLKEEKEERQGEIARVEQDVASKADDFSASVDDERVARLEREAHTLKRVGEDMFRVQEKILEESATRESEIGKLRSELQEVAGSRNNTENKFQAVILEEVAQLKEKLKVETEARISEDEEIVSAINDYTRALQDGLRIVSQS